MRKLLVTTHSRLMWFRIRAQGVVKILSPYPLTLPLDKQILHKPSQAQPDPARLPLR